MKLQDSIYDSQDLVQVPAWILDRVRNALRENYNFMRDSESCCKRDTASSHNFVDLYLKHEKPTEEQINSVIYSRTTGRIIPQ